MANYPFPGDEEVNYQKWLADHHMKESDDYDTRGAYRYGLKPDARGHMGDEFKLDNHITYSTDTFRSKEPDAPPAGRWGGSDAKGWYFRASPTNIKNAGSVEALRDYFRRVEPDVRLILPEHTLEDELFKGP